MVTMVTIAERHDGGPRCADGDHHRSAVVTSAEPLAATNSDSAQDALASVAVKIDYLKKERWSWCFVAPAVGGGVPVAGGQVAGGEGIGPGTRVSPGRDGEHSSRQETNRTFWGNELNSTPMSS
jgi:hypothetical protein